MLRINVVAISSSREELKERNKLMAWAVYCVEIKLAGTPVPFFCQIAHCTRSNVKSTCVESNFSLFGFLAHFLNEKTTSHVIMYGYSDMKESSLSSPMYAVYSPSLNIPRNHFKINFGVLLLLLPF